MLSIPYPGLDPTPSPNGHRLEVVRSHPSRVSVSTLAFAKAFDGLWAEMDRHYSYFYLKSDVDWGLLRAEYRPQALEARSVDAFLAVLQSMLAHLRDLHVWMETKSETLGSYRIPWKPNFNLEVALNQLAEKTRIGPFALVGTTQSDGFGYLLVTRQSSATPRRVQRTVAEIGKRRHAPGFIVDLRAGCNGGDERLAQLLAQVFCPKEVIYAKHKYRNGPCYDDFGRIHIRTLDPSAHPYTRPVVCLIGQGCISSGEALVKMLHAQPQVTTIGERTRGSSGNPKPYALRGLGIRVWFSRWVDLNPNGHPFEGRGIRPKISVPLPLSSYRNQDPTLERAIRFLEHKVASSFPATPRLAEVRWHKHLNGKRYSKRGFASDRGAGLRPAG